MRRAFTHYVSHFPYAAIVTLFVFAIIVLAGLAAVGAAHHYIPAVIIGTIMAGWYTYRLVFVIRLGKKGWESMGRSAEGR
jgi:hypothetical protein